jgi:hypothetical protein
MIECHSMLGNSLPNCVKIVDLKAKVGARRPVSILRVDKTVDLVLVLADCKPGQL